MAIRCKPILFIDQLCAIIYLLDCKITLRERGWYWPGVREGWGGSGWGGSKEQGGVEGRGKPQTCHRKISPQTGVSKLSVNVIILTFSVSAKFPFPPYTLSAMATILLSILLCPVYAANLQHFKENIRLWRFRCFELQKACPTGQLS